MHCGAHIDSIEAHALIESKLLNGNDIVDVHFGEREKSTNNAV